MSFSNCCRKEKGWSVLWCRNVWDEMVFI